MGHRTRLGLIVRARGLGERFGRVDLPLRLRAMPLAMATKNRVRPPSYKSSRLIIVRSITLPKNAPKVVTKPSSTL